MERFAKRLILLLEEQNITQRELAKSVDVTEVTISRYISDDREPKADILTRIADHFNVSTDFLLGRTDIRRTTNASEITTIAAHSDGLTEEDQEKVLEYIELLKLKRK